MVDDTYYITPHEAALATVATSMKKARLHISTLTINSVIGGFLFSSGSMLYIAIHSECPDMDKNNPGILNILGGVSFGIGLFYVVIMGVDLFNSNILFFSTGVLRGAVTIYDLLISWSISLLGNIAGSLFMSYVLVHLSHVGTSKLWIDGSVKIGEDKASYSFIQTFLKAIGGNIYVCMAIYLQLMAKPIHVKLFMLILPVFTFVTIGFSHTVADMSMMYTAMLNGANVSVGKYIWKLLIPAALGNIVGGFAFSLVIPYYLHLVVVERDRKRLSLPKYEARDEQPELNMDSRVVRISTTEREEFSDATNVENEEEEEENIQTTSNTTGYSNEKMDANTINVSNRSHRALSNVSGHTNGQTSSNSRHSSMSTLSASLYSNADLSSSLVPEAFVPEGLQLSNRSKDREKEALMLMRKYTTKSKDGKRHIRSPPGVFPVRGMGTPLTKEKTIEDSTEQNEDLTSRKSLENDTLLSRIHTIASGRYARDEKGEREEELKRLKSIQREEQKEYVSAGGYDVEQNKPSAKISQVLSRIVTGKEREDTDLEQALPRTTQDTFPFNKPSRSHSYESHSTMKMNHHEHNGHSMFHRGETDDNYGITEKIASMTNNVAGIENFSNLDSPLHTLSRDNSGTSGKQRRHHSHHNSDKLKKANTAYIGTTTRHNRTSSAGTAETRSLNDDDSSMESKSNI